MKDVRGRILGRACELYLSKGLDGFSMRELARSVGCTAPALYRHYQGREEVILEVVGEGYRLLSARLMEALGGATPLERLLRAGEEYLEFALAYPRYYEVLYASPDVVGVEAFPESTLEQMHSIRTFWEDRIRECADAGLLRPSGAAEISMTMWAHAHGLLMLYLRGAVRVSEEEFRTLYAESSHRAISGMATERYQEGVREMYEEIGGKR